MKKKVLSIFLLCTIILILQSTLSYGVCHFQTDPVLVATSNATSTYGPLGKDEEALLSQSKTDHLLNHYQVASQEYIDIINNKNISNSVKLKAEAYLALSENDIPLSAVQKYTETYENKANEAREAYIKNKYTYDIITNYDPVDDFLNASKVTYFYTHANLKMDNDGLPMVKYGNDFYYNPVTLSQFILYMHGCYIKNDSDEGKRLAIKGADTLLGLQSSSGAFRLNFSYQHYLNDTPYSPGWVSSMAQGQAISALLRVYSITRDSKYLKAANLSFEFMKTPVLEGGVLDSLSCLNTLTGKINSGSIFYQEYVTSSPSYTLNGYIYTMLGLYDLSKSDSLEASTAKMYFEYCEESLRQILKYYDIGTFTCYDLGYITHPGTPANFNVSYHSIHIELMDTMYSITKDPLYKYYGSMWKSYVQPENIIQPSG